MINFLKVGYTTVGHKLGFGPTRKLPRLIYVKCPNIKNMGPLNVGQPRGFGAVQIQSLWPTVVYFFFLCMGSLSAAAMQPFMSEHVPMREDGKIDIPLNIEHVKLDIGLSYSAPMSQQWLSHEENLWVFGFEPDLSSVHSIKEGALKKQPDHGEPIDPMYVGRSFFVLPCALGLASGELVPFYITKDNCGCSSLYRPIYLEVEKVIDVPVFRLSDFFDVFPFDTHPVVDYIKIDAQGSDLDIVKSAGHYLKERVVYITIEAEDIHYENTTNSERDIDCYMERVGFERFYSPHTADPTYLNTRFSTYAQEKGVQIFQKG